VKNKGKGGTNRASLPTGTKHTERKRTASKPKKSPGRPRGSHNKMFGLKVVEAKEALVIPLLQVDLDKAEEFKDTDINGKDRTLSCVIAQAGTRVCGTEHVAIMREVAYVAFPGEKVAKRYIVDRKSRETLEAWDRGEDVQVGVELRLRPPAKTHTRAALTKSNREFREKHPGVHSTKGGKEGRKTNRKNPVADPLKDVVRNGNLVRWS